MKKISFVLLLNLLGAINFAQSSRSLINDGVNQYVSGKYNDAEINFRKSLDKGEHDFIGNFNLGDAYFKQEKYEDAVRSYQNALAKANNNFEKSKSYFNIGNSFLKSNKLKESIEAYKNSLKLNPNDEDAKYNLSYALKLLSEQQNQNKNDQNKNDQKNDEKKDDQQKKNDDQQNKDKKENQNNQQNQQNQQDKKDQQQPNQPQKQQFSKKEAEAMLDAIKNNEKDLQKKLRKKAGVRVKTEKDW